MVPVMTLMGGGTGLLCLGQAAGQEGLSVHLLVPLSKHQSGEEGGSLVVHPVLIEEIMGVLHIGMCPILAPSWFWALLRTGIARCSSVSR